jgi:small subunit ribosomal protein S16
MALMIRLRQQGASGRQTFRLVVTDRRNPRDGKYLEMLGWYNPLAEGEKSMEIDVPRVLHWMEQGAIISDRARSLVKKTSPEFAQQMAEKSGARRERKHKKKK